MAVDGFVATLSVGLFKLLPVVQHDITTEEAPFSRRFKSPFQEDCNQLQLTFTLG